MKRLLLFAGVVLAVPVFARDPLPLATRDPMPLVAPDPAPVALVTERDYAGAYVDALAIGRPLVVFVRQPSRAGIGVTVRDDSQADVPCVLVGLPDGAGRFDQVTLPGTPTDAEILAAIIRNFRIVQPAASVWAGQWSYSDRPGYHRHRQTDGAVFEHHDRNQGSDPAHVGVSWPYPKYHGPTAPNAACPPGSR